MTKNIPFSFLEQLRYRARDNSFCWFLLSMSILTWNDQAMWNITNRFEYLVQTDGFAIRLWCGNLLLYLFLRSVQLPCFCFVCRWFNSDKIWVKSPVTYVSRTVKITLYGWWWSSTYMLLLTVCASAAQNSLNGSLLIWNLLVLLAHSPVCDSNLIGML